MGTPKPGRITTLTMDGVAIGGAQDMTLDVQRAEIDTTDKDSAGWDEFITGQGSLSLNGTCNYEEDDQGQDDLLDAILNGTQHEFVMRPWGASDGADEWTMFGFPTSVQIDSPNKEQISFPFTIRLTMQPARANQDLFAGTFQLKTGLSGAEQMATSLTINSITNVAKWAYRGGDAGAAIWPAAKGPRDLGKTSPTGAAAYSVDQPAPFTDDTRGVQVRGGDYFAGGDYDAYEWGGAGAGEDFVLEMVVRIDDLTDGGQIIGKSSGSGGWRVFMNANAARLQVFDTGGAANVTIDSGTLESGVWHHLVWYLDQSGSGVCYTDTVVGTPGSLATVTGAADITALEFTIGNEASGVAAAGGQATIAWAAAWGSSAWLDTHLQATVSRERVSMVAGFYPDNASGTTKAPTVMTRADSAFTYVREPIGERVLGHKVGPNWPRVASWGATFGSPVGDPVGGALLEITSENTIRESHDMTSVTSWTDTRLTTALEAAVAGPIHDQEVFSLLSDSTAATTHLVGASLGAIASNAVVSVFAKRSNDNDNGFDWILLSAEDAGATADGTFFNIQTGIVGTSGANVAGAYIEDWGNGWFRCMLQLSTSSDGFSVSLAEADNDAVIAVAPDGGKNCYLTCPMRESAAGVETASSYIRNTASGSDATRAADVVSYKMDDGNMTSAETAWTIDYTLLAANIDSANNPELFALNDGGASADEIRVVGRATENTQLQVNSTEGAAGAALCGATDIYDGTKRDFRGRLSGTAMVHENTTDSESNSDTLAFAGPNDIDTLTLLQDGYSNVLINKIEIYATDLGASF